MTAFSGWYPDPWQRGQLRWWDGRVWTHHVHAEPQLPAPTQDVAITVAEVALPLRSQPDKQAPSLLQMIAELRPHPYQFDLDEQIEVAGETYHVKGIKAAYREAGMPLTDKGSTLELVACALLPEPWNEHDSNAVAVMIGMNHVGYLPAEDAVRYCHPLGVMTSRGHLITGTARVWAKTDAGVVRARVTILIPEAQAIAAAL